MPGRAVVAGVVALLLSLALPAGNTAGLTAAPDFRFSVWATNVGGVRLMCPTPAGDVLAADMAGGRVLLLVGGAERKVAEVRVLLTGLSGPNSVDLADGILYVGEANAVGKVGFDAQTRQLTGTYTRIASLSTGGSHFSRTVRMGPDGWVYAAAGSTCNVCVETNPERAAIIRMHPDGSGREIHAAGLRNSVGFDWQPGTNDLYATDNGRDLLGDDFPPDELNRIVHGGFYGWPFAHGNRVADPDLGAGHEAQIAASITPAHSFRAHNAPLGFTFLRHQRSRLYVGAAVAALHGSWNRSTRDGYKVVSLHWQRSSVGTSIVERDLLTGFLRPGGAVIGRPVGVAETPDGSIYVSDDFKHAIYRLTPTTP